MVSYIGKKTSLNRVKMFLIYGDIFFIALAIFLGILIRLGVDASGRYLKQCWLPLFILEISLITCFYIAGLYDFPKIQKSFFTSTIRTVISILSAFLLTTGLFYSHPSLFVGRGIILLTLILTFVFAESLRLFCFHGSGRKFFDYRTLIVGSGNESQKMLNFLKRNPYGGYIPIDIADESENIRDIVSRKKIRVVILPKQIRTSQLLEKLRICRYEGVQLKDMATVYGELTGEIPLEAIDDEWLLMMSLQHSIFHIKKVKRIFDIAGAFIFLIVTLPISILTVCLIKITSPGPIFHCQKRMGREGKEFSFLKFRTMKIDAEKNGPVWTSPNDSRVTKIGKFLRRFHIDEFPQFINILKGNMSLVGPRPERKFFVNKLAKEIPFYLERLYIQPGLTGWAQIKYPYASNIEQSRRKLQFDLYYIENMSLLFDFVIILKTIKEIWRIVILKR